MVSRNRVRLADAPQNGPVARTPRSRDPNSSLWRIPTEGGAESRVLESIGNHNFAVTSRGLYFMVRTDPNADRYAIRFFSFDDRKTIAAIDWRTYHCLSVSPDERWLLYTLAEPRGSNVMLAENFE